MAARPDCSRSARLQGGLSSHEHRAAIGRLNDWKTARRTVACRKSARPSGKYACEERKSQGWRRGGISNQCWINLSHQRYLQAQFKRPPLVCALSHKHHYCSAYLHSSAESCSRRQSYYSERYHKIHHSHPAVVSQIYHFITFAGGGGVLQ